MTRATFTALAWLAVVVLSAVLWTLAALALSAIA